MLKNLENVQFVKITNNRCDLSDSHQSEKEIDLLPIDKIIVNNGAFDEFYSNIDKVLANLYPSIF